MYDGTSSFHKRALKLPLGLTVGQSVVHLLAQAPTDGWTNGADQWCAIRGLLLLLPTASEESVSQLMGTGATLTAAKRTKILKVVTEAWGPADVPALLAVLGPQPEDAGEAAAAAAST